MIGKDVIVVFVGFFNKDEVFNVVIEFIGFGVEYLFIDECFIIVNMIIEWGVVVGVFFVDDKFKEWY